jgi:hypothetical protein
MLDSRHMQGFILGVAIGLTVDKPIATLPYHAGCPPSTDMIFDCKSVGKQSNLRGFRADSRGFARNANKEAKVASAAIAVGLASLLSRVNRLASESKNREGGIVHFSTFPTFARFRAPASLTDCILTARGAHPILR